MNKLRELKAQMFMERIRAGEQANYSDIVTNALHAGIGKIADNLASTSVCDQLTSYTKDTIKIKML